SDALRFGGTAHHPSPRSFPTRRSSDLLDRVNDEMEVAKDETFGPIVPISTIRSEDEALAIIDSSPYGLLAAEIGTIGPNVSSLRSEEHTSELQSRREVVCRLLLVKRNK